MVGTSLEIDIACCPKDGIEGKGKSKRAEMDTVDSMPELVSMAQKEEELVSEAR